ncbi:MAG: peptidylprolyl isomerase fpr4 [Vezdaea aestivalis]|nr:MAG: peptidylprolyl isomerase fpr4 [Vezdaea aestivalis]
MASHEPRGVYTLTVVPGDSLVEANGGVGIGSFRITMAAIDPSEPTSGDSVNRSTLKLLRQEDDYDSYLQSLLGMGDLSSGSDESDSESDSDTELNGGPSDPAKVYGARAAARMAQMQKDLELREDEDEDMGVPNGLNGRLPRKSKGKQRASSDSEEDSSDEGSDSDLKLEKAVLCTLDPEKNWQQPLDIVIGGHEKVFFQVIGSHPIFLSGNYIATSYAADSSDDNDEGEDDEDYLDFDAMDEMSMSDESDELDDLEDPRIKEVSSDEEDPESPQLTLTNGLAGKSQKGKNKRPAEDEEISLDDLIAKSIKPTAGASEKTNGQSKKAGKKEKASQDKKAVADKKDDEDSAANQSQRKKMKNNAGKGVSPTTGENSKSDKKVQFAAKLEQGPSNSAKENKAASSKAETTALKANDDKPKGKQGAMSARTVDGVKIEDQKIGNGPQAKKGDRVAMRYIGKLQNGKRFDANSKGKPFTCKLGAGEVIKGWDIGLLGMTPGGERRITVPAHLAYGSRAQSGIPANSALIFDLKLLTIN